MTISRMRRHAPFVPTGPNFCMLGGVTDVINCAKFFGNRFRGSGAGRPWKWHFPLKAFVALTTVLRYRADCDWILNVYASQSVCLANCYHICQKKHWILSTHSSTSKNVSWPHSSSLTVEELQLAWSLQGNSQTTKIYQTASRWMELTGGPCPWRAKSELGLVGTS